MTAATNFAFDSRFDGFLHALVGTEGNTMPISILSALARLDVDPWTEAARLSTLPKEAAARRLVSLMEQLPVLKGWESGIAADRLIKLLPQPGEPAVSTQPGKQGLFGITPSVMEKMLISAVLAAAFMALFPFEVAA